MLWDIHAVTVSPWYLDRSCFVLKTLKVTASKHKRFVWHVVATLSVSPTKARLMKDAFYIARQKHVPYIGEVSEGSRVTKAHWKQLQNSGVAVEITNLMRGVKL